MFMKDNSSKITKRRTMNDRLPRSFGQLFLKIGPCILLGIAIAFAIGLIILFYYVVLWGIFIGLVLWLAGLIRRYLFPQKPLDKEPTGRIIDYDKNDE